jgi:hypothetical protein
VPIDLEGDGPFVPRAEDSTSEDYSEEIVTSDNLDHSEEIVTSDDPFVGTPVTALLVSMFLFEDHEQVPRKCSHCVLQSISEKQLRNKFFSKECSPLLVCVVMRLRGNSKQSAMAVLTPAYKDVEDWDLISAALRLCKFSFELLWVRACVLAEHLQKSESIVTWTGPWEKILTKRFLADYTSELLRYQGLTSEDEPYYEEE